MADQDNLNLEDVGGGSEEVSAEGRRVGFLPAFVIQILKWVAIGLGFILLAVTTVIITMNVVGRNQGSTPLDLASPAMEAKAPPLLYDDAVEDIRGVTVDEPPSVFILKLSLGYMPDEKALAMELTARRRQIQSLVLTMISNKSRDELKPEHYDTLLNELKLQINKLLQNGQIREVVFREFMVTQ